MAGGGLGSFRLPILGRYFMRIIVAAILAAAACAVHAQAYPAKPIRLLVPFAPGGSSSIIARAFSTEMSLGLGQQFVVENKPGGGGNIAMEEAARAEPDGYTLIIGHIGTFAVNPFMFAKLPFDTNRDFRAVSLFAKVPQIYVVHESVPAKDLREFIALAKKDPGKLYYGSAGNGSAGHLAVEYLKLVSGMDIQHVPYKGTGPNLLDLVAGRTQFSAAGTPPFMPHVKSGKLRPVAVTTSHRSQALPELPTIAESGVPGYEAATWYGLLAPAGTPKAIVDRLHAEIVKILATDTRQRLAAQGFEPAGTTPAEFAGYIKSEIVKWGKVINAAGIRPE